MLNRTGLPNVLYFLLTLVILTSASCVKEPSSLEKVTNTPNTMIDAKQGTELATREFLKTGRKLEDYRSPVTTECAEEWMIYFEHKTPKFPGGCTFMVNKKTGKVRRGVEM